MFRLCYVRPPCWPLLSLSAWFVALFSSTDNLKPPGILTCLADRRRVGGFQPLPPLPMLTPVHLGRNVMQTVVRVTWNPLSFPRVN